MSSCSSKCQCCRVSSVGVLKAKTKRQFMFSGFSSDSTYLRKIQNKVSKLNGVCLDDSIYHSECTHVICENLIRSEKVLCALAAGKWILTPEYVVQSYRKGKWLSEEEYEWNVSCQSQKSQSIYVQQAPQCSRQIVHRTKKGLFCTWVSAVALSDKSKTDVFKRLLSAGESRIVSLKFPLSERNRNLSRLTHIFCDKENLKDLKIFKERCIHPDFIANYLFRGKSAKESDFRTMTYKPTNNPLLTFWHLNGEAATSKEGNRKLLTGDRSEVTNKGTKRKVQQKSTPSKKLSVRGVSDNVVRNGPMDKFVFSPKRKAEEVLPIPECKVVVNNCVSVSDDDDDIQIIAEFIKAKEDVIEVEVLPKKVKTEIVANERVPKNDEECRILMENALEKEMLLIDIFPRMVACSVSCETNNYTKVKSEELPELYACSLLTSTDSDHVLLQISSLHSLVVPITYPSADVLTSLLWTHIWEGIDDHVVFEAFNILLKVFALHPPTSPKMQNFYRRVLCCAKPESNYINPFSAWQNILKVINSYEVENSENEQVLRFQRNRYHTLKFILKVLEFDLNYVWKHRTSSNEIPLLIRLVWPNNKPNYITNAVDNLIRAVMSLTPSVGKDEEFSIVDLSFNLLDMVGLCCQQNTQEAGLKLQPIPFKFSSTAIDFCHRIVISLQSSGWDCNTLHSLYLKLPTWLALGVSWIVLESSAGSSSSKSVLSLENTHSVYLNSTIRRKNGAEKLAVVKREIENSEKKFQSGSVNNNSPSCTSKMSPFKQAARVTQVNVNKRNIKGESPLHLACMRGDVMKVQALLDCPGIDINAKDNAGWTPLHEAANRGATECIRQLLNYKPKKTLENYFNGGRAVDRTLNLFAVGVNDFTALHDAVLNNHVEAAKLLYKRGGKKLLKMATSAGLTATDLAPSDEMKNALKKESVKRDLFCSQKVEPLHNFPKDRFDDEKIMVDSVDGPRFVAIFHFVVSFCSTNRLFPLQRALKLKCDSYCELARHRDTLWPFKEGNHLQILVSQLEKMPALFDGNENKILNELLTELLSMAV